MDTLTPLPLAGRLRQYTLYTLPPTFELPPQGPALNALADRAADRLGFGGIDAVFSGQGDGCTLMAFTHAARKDRPARAFDRETCRNYTVTYPPRNSEMIFVDRVNRLLYVSPFSKGSEAALEAVLLDCCAPGTRLVRGTVTFETFRTLPPEMFLPGGGHYPWRELGLVGLTTADPGRNAGTCVRKWQSDAYGSFRTGEFEWGPRILAVTLLVRPEHVRRHYTLEIAADGSRLRACLDAVSLPIAGTLMRTCFLEEAV